MECGAQPNLSWIFLIAGSAFNCLMLLVSVAYVYVNVHRRKTDLAFESFYHFKVFYYGINMASNLSTMSLGVNEIR